MKNGVAYFGLVDSAKISKKAIKGVEEEKQYFQYIHFLILKEFFYSKFHYGLLFVLVLVNIGQPRI